MKSNRAERRIVVACDVSGVTVPDLATLEALARLQLTARRLGATIELRNVAPAFAEFIAAAGLTDVLVIGESGLERSGIEVDGEAEESEEVGVDEEIHLGDGPG